MLTVRLQRTRIRDQLWFRHHASYGRLSAGPCVLHFATQNGLAKMHFGMAIIGASRKCGKATIALQKCIFASGQNGYTIVASPPWLKCLKKVGPIDNWLCIYGVALQKYIFVYILFTKCLQMLFCTAHSSCGSMVLRTIARSAMVPKAELEHFAMQNYVQSPKKRVFYLNIFME